MTAEREIKKILHEYLQYKDNMILSDRIFVAISILNWAYLKYKDQEILRYYLEEVKKHLRNEITLYWEDGIVKIKRGKR